MPEVYYYVKSEKVSDIMDCGLKLSTCYNKEIIIGGEKKLCFSALLNPKDDLERYKSDSYTCLKIQVKSEQCFVADKFIYETVGEKHLELYYNSIIPIEKYFFGQYRLPECLITTTILAGEATTIDKRIDSPVLYSNAEELYIHNILQEFREQYSKIDDCLVYCFLEKLADLEKLDKIENSSTGTVIYRNVTGKSYCVKKPEIEDVMNSFQCKL